MSAAGNGDGADNGRPLRIAHAGPIATSTPHGISTALTGPAPTSRSSTRTRAPFGVVLTESERAVSRKAARLHRSAAGLELESLDQREALLVEKSDGERVRPALTSSGRVPLALGDRVCFTDGKSPIITVVVEEA